ncbi:MAG: 50S ribosomal protein L11 methyltransferase [Acetobacteraceae bacterium]|nr:50S ribosomal protein L11 methyltransferase [Acetobacteraceae bacterium]
MRRREPKLETLVLDGLPDEAVPAYEAALLQVCATVAMFRDEAADTWRLEAVREAGAGEAELSAALALAAAVTGHAARPDGAPVEAEGWLARTAQAFPEMALGRRFLIRPTHVPPRRDWGRHVLTLDAGIAFGSGEHNSTRGCLLALEGLRLRHNARVLDLGAGSGILAMGAAKLRGVRVLATDIEPWSVRVANENAKLNGLRGRVHSILADGWRNQAVRAGGPYDLVFANILARPLCAMARDLADHLAPGGVAILAGLLGVQARMVLAAHRAQGLVLERRLDLEPWCTLVLRRRG